MEIYNSSLKEGWILMDSKIGTMTLISKARKSFTKNISTLRPITLLNSSSKILETVVANCIMKYYEEIRLISDQQYRFTKRIRTQDALTNAAYYFQHRKIKYKQTRAMQLDLKGAFDQVSRRKLLGALARLQIPRYLYN